MSRHSRKEPVVQVFHLDEELILFFLRWTQHKYLPAEIWFLSDSGFRNVMNLSLSLSFFIYREGEKSSLNEEVPCSLV